LAGVLISWDNFESGNNLCPTRLFCPARLINARNRTGFTEKICLKAAGWISLRALNDESRLRLSFSALFCANKKKRDNFSRSNYAVNLKWLKRGLAARATHQCMRSPLQ